MEEKMVELIKAIEGLGEMNVGDKISLALSVIAVVAAIWVPRSIAEKQNKIALFGRRSDVFSRLADAFYNKPMMETALINSYNERKGKERTFKNVGRYDKLENAAMMEATFLFSSEISGKIHELDKLRKDFFCLEDGIAIGVSCFSNEDLNEYFKLAEEVALYEVDHTDKMKDLAAKYPFCYPESDGTLYDIYTIGIQQETILKKIAKLQDEITKGMADEMNIYKKQRW